MKFLLNGMSLAIMLILLTILSLFVGVSKVSITDIFHLTQEQRNIIIS
ncbi:ABC transporter permease, partial [Staphylococcus arlettae]|nr:ABC transporter permease [Staphylococcus arlettae]